MNRFGLLVGVLLVLAVLAYAAVIGINAFAVLNSFMP
jgi:hypothetical protein